MLFANNACHLTRYAFACYTAEARFNSGCFLASQPYRKSLKHISASRQLNADEFDLTGESMEWKDILS